MINKTERVAWQHACMLSDGLERGAILPLQVSDAVPAVGSQARGIALEAQRRERRLDGLKGVNGVHRAPGSLASRARYST